MLIVAILGVLHVALLSADMQTCPDMHKGDYFTFTCGAPGEAGQPGLNGTDGQKGEKGDPGLPGVAGLPGPRGRLGLSGQKGEKGDIGLLGPPGPDGPMGKQGAPGQMGEKGDSGAFGLDLLTAQCNALIGQVQDLQSSLAQQKKVLDLFNKTVRSGGKLYTSIGAQANYVDTVALCTKTGGSLATPHNASENDAILSLRNYYAMNAYLGINDLLTQGVFRDLYGESILYTNWAPSEPNNLPTEYCVEMYNTGKWNNKPCEKTALVICEF